MRKPVLVLLLLLIFISGGANTIAQKDFGDNQGVLRLHIIANSDSDDDQELKLQVKNRIVAMMQIEFAQSNSSEEAFALAEKRIGAIRAAAEEIVHDQGYEYPVQVHVGNYNFPVKSYGNIIFPAGSYPAVKIILGEGQGRNWWCVLFPPLCLVASSDKGLSLDNPREAEITFKLLELIPDSILLKSGD